MKLFGKTKGSLLAIEGNEVLLYNSTREGATSDVRMHSSEATGEQYRRHFALEHV